MAQAIVEPVPGLNESKAKFVVISNVLGGIRDYDCGSWLEPEAHEDVAMAVMQHGRRSSLPRPLNRDVGRLLRIAWQTELAARVSDAYDDDMLRRVAAQTLPVQSYYAVFNAARGNDHSCWDGMPHPPGRPPGFSEPKSEVRLSELGRNTSRRSRFIDWLHIRATYHVALLL